MFKVCMFECGFWGVIACIVVFQKKNEMKKKPKTPLPKNF